MNNTDTRWEEEAEKHKVFGDPKILSHIFELLYSDSQVACLQVCHHFHTLIVPMIYSSVTLGPLQVCRPSLEAMRRYSSLVTSLAFDGFISAEYLEAGFTNLESLSITNDEESHHFRKGTDEEIMEALLKVIKDNPRLSQWAFENPYPALSAKVWEAIDVTASRRTEEFLVEESLVQQPNSTSTTPAAIKHTAMSAVVVPQGGSDIHRISFRIEMERAHPNRVRSAIKVLQVVPASISQEALPFATSACENAEALLMIPTKLITIANYFCNDYPARVLPQPKTPIAHYVGLQNVPHCSAMEQLEFLSHFNQARGIYWNITKRPWVADTQREPPTIGHWEQLVQPNMTWPHLKSLALCCYKPKPPTSVSYPNDKAVFPDDCVAYVLNCISFGQLQLFWWYGSQMGPLAIKALSGHFSTLSEIKLELTSSLENSAYIQRIMESCHQLRVLRAGHLSIGDMRRGRSWVCLGLQSLSLRFDMPEGRIPEESGDRIGLPTTRERDMSGYEESQRYVFFRLSELIQLRELTSIPLQAAGADFYQTWHLDFQLKYGLNALATLGRLQRLKVSYTKQQMGLEEIEWMIENWKMLQSIEGSLSGNREEDAILKTFLNTKNISLYRQ
ncbi:hypothetical protein BGZ95_009675 [Linnemannia exigua]|uniref:F-box domain-containing protein n=1 Tax=Linnemannia exigua TaxID=604196 RepID=A0AAD4DKH3_9FUNG|nr:hypothetical protein BGZ95_009675 [Linnemannia exigua]